MRRSDVATVAEVFKRDGRREAFDRDKLARALHEALEASGEASGCDDLGAALADVIVGALGSDRAGAWSTSDVAALALDVLESSGCTGAAHAWRAVDRARRRWRAPADAEQGEVFSKGRVLGWLGERPGLEPAVADDVAASVERRLFAAGLACPGEPLLRAWVDDELARRGVGARVGRDAAVRIDPARLRGDLSARRPGDDVVRAAGVALLGAYASREVHAPAVVAAHERGLLALGDVVAPGRVQRIVVRDEPLDRARLERLREASAEPVVVLAGAGGRWRELLPTETRDGLAGVEVVATDAATARALLAEVTGPRPGALSGSALVAVADDAWCAAEEVRDTLSLRRAAPAPGVVAHGVALNAAGLAHDVGPDLERFVARLARLVSLARTAVDARAAHAGPPAWPDASTLAADVGLELPPRGAELALAGLDEAFAQLALTTVRGALTATRRVRAVLGTRVVAPSRAVLARFGAEDLRRHPELRDRVPLDPSRTRFAYDVPRPVPARVAARIASALLAPDAPLPRTCGARRPFVHSLSPPHQTPRPCA